MASDIFMALRPRGRAAVWAAVGTLGLMAAPVAVAQRLPEPGPTQTEQTAEMPRADIEMFADASQTPAKPRESKQTPPKRAEPKKTPAEQPEGKKRPAERAPVKPAPGKQAPAGRDQAGQAAAMRAAAMRAAAEQAARQRQSEQPEATAGERAEPPADGAGPSGDQSGDAVVEMPSRRDSMQDDVVQDLLSKLPPEALNSLIGADIQVEVVGDQMFLRGPQEAVKALQAVILALDAADEQKLIEVVRVEKRDANEIANTLEPVLREMLTEPNMEAEDEVSIKALSASLVLVSALPKDIDFVVALIHQVDEEEEGIAKIEQLVFPVQYLKAKDVAEQLQEMLRKIQEKRGATGSQAEIQVVPNNANNTIMVFAPEEDRAKIQQLLDSIDVEPSADWSELKLVLFPLLHSKANELADVINNLLASDQSREATEEVILRLQISKALASGEIVDLPPIDLQKTTRITPDEGTNSLIVSTVKENVKPMQELIDLLDGVPMAEGLEVKVYPLRFADAETISNTIKDIFNEGKNLPEDPDGSGQGGVPTGELAPGLVYNIGVFADVRSNTLIFTGRPSQALLVERIINELDRPATALKFPLRMVTLEYTDATRVGQIITELFDQRFQALEATEAGKAALERERVFLSVDLRSNSFIVSASEENYQEIVTITKQLDTKPGKLFDQIRIINCDRLSASDLKTKIEELWQRKADLRREEELIEDLPIVVADERSNALIVASSVEDYEEIKRLVEVLEAQPLNDDTRMFKLEVADSVVLAQMLDELFQGMESQLEAFKAPTIIPDPRSNALVVAATRDTMERVEDLVTRLDIEAGPLAAVFKVYPLTYGSSTKLAPRMQELFDTREQESDIKRTPVVILADEASNSLVCSASRDDHDVIVDLLGLLDRPSSIAKQFQIFPLKLAKAARVAEKLDTLFQSQAEGASGRADATAVEADERTNSIIVWASPSEMENVAEVIARLDTSSPAVEMTVKIVQLKQALAEDFATLLTDGLLGDNAGADDEKAVILSWTEKKENGEEVTRKLLRQDIQVKADPRTNSLMVVAPSDSIAMLESMIRDFDTIRPIQSEIRLFPLINADAQGMVDQLTELFQASSTEGETVRQFNFGDAFSDVDFARVGQELRFTADARTNTVIAAGAEVDLRMIEELIRYLDAQEAEDRVFEVVQAKFLDAQELADAIQNFNQQEQDVLGLTDDEESFQRRMERQVSVEAVGNDQQGSSRLIIGTSRNNYPQTMEMISQLDRPEPQVMISVLIAEVQLRDGVELGMEIAGQDLHFSENAVVGPNGVVQGDQFDYVLGTDLGAAPLGLGGVNFTITGEDFSFLLHALQTDSRTETLSRPILMVRNGEEGKLTIADQVPYVGSTQLNDTGSTNSTIAREDVGLVLTATPNISPDGYVTIALEQELSNITGEDIQLTEGVASPIFQERKVQTNITIRDGETVIIGGLITTRDEDTENKVPIFGDLPYIGPLFRVTKNSTEKTEMLIVLTVDIMRTDEDRYQMSVEQRDKFVLPESIRQNPLMEGLRILPEDSALGPVDSKGKLKPMGPEAPQPREQRELYGPQPKVYGPTISKPRDTSAAVMPEYGPHIARSDMTQGG